MTMFAMFFTEYNKALGATGRIIGILEMENEKSAADTEELLTYETLSFNNVTFGYDKTPVLENISLPQKIIKRLLSSVRAAAGNQLSFP